MYTFLDGYYIISVGIVPNCLSMCTFAFGLRALLLGGSIMVPSFSSAMKYSVSATAEAVIIFFRLMGTEMIGSERNRRKGNGGRRKGLE